MFRNAIITALLAGLATVAACTLDHRPSTDETSAPALIQSRADLDAYLRATPNSPIDLLSAASKQRFLASLVFTAKGLASYNYADLQAELPEDNVNEILTLFGLERTTPLVTDSSNAPTVLRMRNQTDYKDYKCSGPGSCYTDSNSICTSNC